MEDEKVFEQVNQVTFFLPEDFREEEPDQTILYDWNGGVLSEAE